MIQLVEQKHGTASAREDILEQQFSEDERSRILLEKRSAKQNLRDKKRVRFEEEKDLNQIRKEEEERFCLEFEAAPIAMEEELK